MGHINPRRVLKKGPAQEKGKEGVPAVSREDAAAPESPGPKRRGRPKSARDPEGQKEKVGLWIDRVVVEKLRSRAEESHRTMGDVVESALREYLA
jgi:hypothetical protein